MIEGSPTSEGRDNPTPVDRHANGVTEAFAAHGPEPTLLTPGGSAAEIPPTSEAGIARNSPLFIENITWGAQLVVEPAQAARILEPLAENLFTPRPHRIISWVDISRNHDYIDPPSGPAIGGLFHGHIPDSFTPDLAAPADLVFAQKSKDSGLITAEWHAIEQLGMPTEVCGEGSCLRLLYRGGNAVEVQDINGEPLEIADEWIALTGLRWLYVNLDTSGMAYDVSGIVHSTNQLAQQIVGAGHQLTIPDAAVVSRACQFPYPTR